MMDMDFFQLLYNHLKKRRYNNICQNSTQDTNYLKATILENELNAEYEKLDLSDEQRNVIMQWLDAIHAQEAAYTVVAFRMGMQCFFLTDAVGRFIITRKISGISKLLGLGIPLILCFYLVKKGILFPLYPLVSAIVTWIFMGHQGECYKIVTSNFGFGFGCPYVHSDGNFHSKVSKLFFIDNISFDKSHFD